MGWSEVEEVRPGGDTLIYFSVCGCGVQEEAVGPKDSLEDREAGEGVEMGETWSEGVGWGDGCGGGGMRCDIGRFQVGAPVFVAPVERGNGRQVRSRWHVDRLDTTFAGWAAYFHDEGEGCRVQLAVFVGVDDGGKVEVAEVVGAVITVCHSIDGVLL